MQGKFDKYNRVARIYPSIIILLPFLVFTMYCNIDGLNEVFDNLQNARIIGNVAISVVLLFLLVQVNRCLGKFLFEKYLFKNELEMPTTNFMLFSNSEFSKEYKILIRKKITDDFNIGMPDENEELVDLENVRRRIVESVGLIRHKVGKGRLLHQHSIEYGFFRNLIGGSLVGVAMSLFNICYFYANHNNLIAGISIVFACCFLLVLVLSKTIINHLGNLYAKRLYQEYLQL